MQAIGRCCPALLAVVLIFATMAHAAYSSGEQLENSLESGGQMVHFSNVSGAETPETAEIVVPCHSKLAVRLACVSGYRALLLSAQEGAVDIASNPVQDLSTEDVQGLLQGAIMRMPKGVVASQPEPVNVQKGLGFVGGPTSYVSVVNFDRPGNFSLTFSIMRLWMPHSGKRYAVKVHVMEENAERGN